MTDELNNPADQPSQTPASGETAVPSEPATERPAPLDAEQVVPEPPLASAQESQEVAPPQPAPGDSPTEVPPAPAAAAEEAPAEPVPVVPSEPVAPSEPAAASEPAVQGGESAGVSPEKPAKKPAPASKKAKKVEPVAEPQGPKSENMQWYILKVQSNREESIREGLLRRIAIAGLDQYVGEVIVPIEKVTEFKGGKRRVTKRKLYPGYLVVQMEINEDTWFVVRETPGIGDFTGASGHPTTMLPHEVSRILAKKDEKTDEQPKLDIKFRAGDRVKINEGTFDNFEGEVDSIDQTNGRVTVMINIFGRSTPVELEYWQIESI